MGKELKETRNCVFIENPPFPSNILVELTNCCNHRCIFCHYNKMKRSIKECQKDFTFDILQQAFDNGCRDVGFYMIGEPLLKKDLADYIAYANKIGFEYIYLTTNGVFATLEKMKELINAGLSSIKFSVNGATPEHYLKIHGVDDYLTVKENIKKLHDYISEEKIDLAMFISFIKTEITKNDIEELQKEFIDYVDKIYIFDVVSQGIPMQELIEKRIVNPAIYLKEEGVLCEMVFNRIHVTCEGFLNACCFDCDGVLNAVDLHVVPLLEAWNSNIMKDLRRRFLQKNLLPLACYNCIHKTNLPVKPLNEELFNRSTGSNQNNL